MSHVLIKILLQEFIQGHYIYLVKFCEWPLNRESDWYKETELRFVHFFFFFFLHSYGMGVLTEHIHSKAKVILDEYIKLHSLLPVKISRYPKSNFELLAHLFDEERLKQQYLQLIETQPTGNRVYSVQDPIQRLMKSYTAHNERQFTLTSLLRSHLPHTLDASLEDQSLGANVLLDRLSTALQILPQLTSNAHVMQVWTSSIHWQYCRSVLILYNFVTQGLPELTELLFTTYKDDRKFLLDHYAGCGRLVTEIMKFLEAHVQKYRQNHRRSAKGTLAVAVDQNSDPKDLILPGDLYGLRTQSDDLDELTVVLKHQSLKPEKMYAEGKDMFTDILISHLVVPHLPKIEANKKWNSKGTTSTASQVLDDYLLRGAVLQTIVDETDDESIFASADIQPLLYGSILPLWDKQGAVNRIANRIRKNPDEAIAHIRQWLTENTTQVVKNLAFDFGLEVHRRTLQYIHGRKLSNADYDAAFDDEAPKHTWKKKLLPDDPRALVLSDVIQPNKDYIAFGVPGLIVREILNEKSNT